MVFSYRRGKRRRSRFGGLSGTLTALAVLAVVAVGATLLGPRYDPVSGRARVSDGDSFRLGEERIRLLDIDAPEYEQTCTDASGADWPCGRAARDHMARLLASGTVSCSVHGHDRFGRLLANCEIGGRDLGREMVSAGLAIANGGYDHEEQQARRQRLGIWAGAFDTPRAWRDDHQDGLTPLKWLSDLFSSPQT